MAKKEGTPENQESQQPAPQPQAEVILSDHIANDRMSVPVATTLPSAEVPAEPPTQPSTPTSEPMPQPTPPSPPPQTDSSE